MSPIPKNPPTKFPQVFQNRWGKVNIYKCKGNGGHRYFITWSTGRGRNRESRSQWQDAVGRAEEILEDYATGNHVRNSLSTRDIAYYHQLEKQLGDTPLERAVEYYIANHSERVTSLHKLITLYNKYQEKRGMSKRHTATEAGRSSRFERFLGPDILLSEITLDHMKAFLDSYENPKTKKGYRGHLVNLFKFARSEGFLDLSLVTLADRLPKPKLKKTDPEFYSAGDLAGMLQTAEADSRYHEIIPYVVVCAFAGMRSAEACRLKWEDIDFHNKHLVLSSSITKTNRRRVVRLDGALLHWLIKYRNSTGPIVEGKPHTTLAKLREDAGVKSVSNGLRKGFITHALGHYKDPTFVADIAGHSIQMMQSTYKGLLTNPKDATTWFNTYPSAYTNQ